MEKIWYKDHPMKDFKRVRLYFIVILLCFFLSYGCSSQKSRTDEHFINSTSVTVASLSITPEPSLEKTQSPTKSPNDSTRKPSLTPTVFQSENSILICKQKGEPSSPPEGFGLNGSIVYLDNSMDVFYSVGGMPLKYSKLPISKDTKYQVIGFSPDGEWFAYFPKPNAEGGKIISLEINLLSSSGEKRAISVPLDIFVSHSDGQLQVTGWSTIDRRWLNNNLIFLYVYLHSSFSEIGSDLPGIMDPFLSIWRDDLIKAVQDGNYDHDIKFSGDLTRVLFTNNEGIVLRNLSLKFTKLIDNNKQLIQSGAGPSGPFFEWSPDNTRFVYGLKVSKPEYRKVILMTRDGELIKEILPPQYSNQSLIFLPGALDWSPDSKMIAITGEIYNTETKMVETKILYVYNLATGDFVYQCPLTYYESLPSSFWSPDSRYLVPFAKDPSSSILLYEINTGDVIKLSDQGTVAGWSDKFK
jgi:hypothetical protein